MTLICRQNVKKSYSKCKCHYRFNVFKYIIHIAISSKYLISFSDFAIEELEVVLGTSVGANMDDYDVYFSSAKVNGELDKSVITGNETMIMCSDGVLDSNIEYKCRGNEK